MKSSLVISPVTKNGKPAFVVNIPAGVSGGTRKRKFFRKLTTAETFVREWRSEVSDYGTLWTALSERQRAGILCHVHRLAEAGWSLGDATDHILKHGKAPPSMLLGIVAEQFLQAKAAKACRPRYLAKLKGSISLFLIGRRDRPIAEITVTDVEEYLNRNGWAGATRRTHWIDIRSLFSFALKRGHCRENVAAQVEAPILDEKPPGILTVTQCVALLDACQRRRPEVLSWLTLCLFAGVRVEEALRLTADAIPADHILISGMKAKTRRRRLVPITPQIRAWLDAAKPHCPKLIPANWRKCFAEIRHAAGLCDPRRQRNSLLCFRTRRHLRWGPAL